MLTAVFFIIASNCGQSDVIVLNLNRCLNVFVRLTLLSSSSENALMGSSGHSVWALEQKPHVSAPFNLSMRTNHYHSMPLNLKMAFYVISWQRSVSFFPSKREKQEISSGNPLLQLLSLERLAHLPPDLFFL